MGRQYDDGVNSTQLLHQEGDGGKGQGEKGHIPVSGPLMFDVVALILARNPWGRAEGDSLVLKRKGEAVPYPLLMARSLCGST